MTTSSLRWKLAFGMVLAASACKSERAVAPVSTPSSEVPFVGPDLLPKPKRLRASSGSFTLSEATVIRTRGDGASDVGSYLADALSMRTGHKPTLVTEGQAPAIVLEVTGTGHPESYTLNVQAGAVTVESPTSAGLFYGAQTVLQLLPAGKVELPAQIPAIAIEDEPRFAWRGMHLDVSRHFFPVAFVKRYIDLLALHKMNRFHWHLTDDHGWRIEIKKYPRLTAVGAWREDHRDEDWKRPAAFRKKVPAGAKPYGGFYTQDEIREIVAYATARHITVVPEVDMPGHAQAALAAYPELSCVTNKKYTVAYGIVYPFSDPLCPCEESTYAFVENVLTELMELFPSPFIHIGADEVNKSSWQASKDCQSLMKKEGMTELDELQSYFVKRVVAFVIEQGRRVVGWQEMMEGGAPPGAVIMPWKDGAALLSSAKAGHDTVVANSEVYYFTPVRSAGQTDWTTLQRTYEYDPVPAGLSPNEEKLVLGGQGHLWSEESQMPADVEYGTGTAMAAVADALWVARDARQWEDFFRRLPAHFKRFDALAMNYFVPRPKINATPWLTRASTVTIDRPPLAESIRFTLDGSDPDLQSQLYDQPFEVDRLLTVKARAYYAHGHPSRVSEAKLTKLEYHEGKSEGGVPGIAYQYLEGGLERAKDFDLLKKTLRKKGNGVLPTVTLPPGHRAEEFVVRYSGKVLAEGEGVYVVCSESNDGTLVFIGDELVVDNDGIHGIHSACGEVALRRGHHPIAITYFQMGGTTALRVDFFYKGHPQIELAARLLTH